MIQLAVRFGMNWLAQVDAPWFVAGVMGAGVPAGLAAGSVVTADGQAFFLVTAIGGALGGVAADRLSSSLSSYMTGCSFTCYDVLTRGVGPACLLLVILVPEIRRNGNGGGGGSSNGPARSGSPSPSAAVSVKPAAFAALASLLLEPLFAAFVLGNATVVGGRNAASGGILAVVRRFADWPLELLTSGVSNTLGRRRNNAAAVAAANAAAIAVSRARWLTGGAQLALWIATMLSLGRIALRSARASRRARRTVGMYMAALRDLASRKRGTGALATIERQGDEGFEGSGGTAPNSLVPGRGKNGGWKDEGCRPRSHSTLGSLYERLAGGWKSGAGSCLFEANCPPYERGEVTVRGLYCSGLDVALTGKTSAKYAAAASGAPIGADRGGGIAGGGARPFYVTITLENVTARTSVRTGFCPTFTEVFPLGIDCPIRGAILVLTVVDSFETGRSGRGDRVVGQAQVPVDAADLVSGSLADSLGGGPTYRLKGEWELRGVVGAGGMGAWIGAEIVVRGPPDPNSAAGRLRRRESVGWYAR